MARQKLSYVKKVLIVGGLICLGQLFTMWRLRANQPPVVSLKDYMTNLETDTAGGTSEQRLYTKLQIALSDYRIKNGKYPPDLEALVPDYFDVVPTDPSTSEPFGYALYKDTFKLGPKALTLNAQEANAGAGNNLGISPLELEVAPGSKEEQALLIASLTQDGAVKIYDSTAKRDPFLPYDFSPKQVSIAGKAPLEQVPYERMRLSAVLLGFEPKAIIEIGSGKGYTVSIGDKVGLAGGEIKKIEQNKVTILESVIDFTGEKKTRIIELKILQRSLQ